MILSDFGFTFHLEIVDNRLARLVVELITVLR